MRIAITGATGFVGQNLIPILFSEFVDARVLTINQNVEKADRLYPIEEYPRCIHIRVDELDRLIDFNPEVTIHLATLTTACNDTAIIKPMIAANIEFGVLLLDALMRCSAMKLFVNTGSFAEYRLGPGLFDSAYLYTASYSVYGGKRTVKRIMDYIIESMYSEEPVNMTAGEQVLDFIHVDDVAGFYTYVVEHVAEFCHLEKNGEEFHLGTGRGTSIREVAALVEDIFGRKCNINWGGRPYRDRDTMYAVAPIAKNLLLTGWTTTITLRDGILKMKNNWHD